ncbi:hypothetical protein ACQPX6_29725 [Actinomycetospora sp. CA-101289]|uniref:hypothetical protein n=1 Tax=Actinomycetospora sp. CA-101289 TaxID=3239893 RepID=UPI003D953EEE
MTEFNALLVVARLCSQLPELVRQCAEAIAEGITDDTAVDFEMFEMRYPTPDELEEWCSATAKWIAAEPVNAEKDRRALLGLGAVHACLRSFPSPLRYIFARQFWLAFAEVSDHAEALEAA